MAILRQVCFFFLPVTLVFSSTQFVEKFLFFLEKEDETQLLLLVNKSVEMEKRETLDFFCSLVNILSKKYPQVVQEHENTFLETILFFRQVEYNVSNINHGVHLLGYCSNLMNEKLLNTSLLLVNDAEESKERKDTLSDLIIGLIEIGAGGLLQLTPLKRVGQAIIADGSRRVFNATAEQAKENQKKESTIEEEKKKD